MLTIADVLEALTGDRPEWGQQEIVDAIIDSRQATPGSVFIAIAGERVDGHDFVGEAFEKGAVLALVEHEIATNCAVIDLREGPGILPKKSVPLPFCVLVGNTVQALQQIAGFWRRQLDVQVIGITGSVGKSTTKELVTEVLRQRYRTLKNQGNLNNEIGLPLTMLKLNEKHQRAVLEMGFYVPGEISLLCGLAQPSIGVITNIGMVHAERAGSLEAIASGKAELVEALPEDGVAILNYDDLRVRRMAEKTRAKVFFYGMSSQADLWAEDVEGLGLDGIRLRLHFRNEVLHLHVPLIGRHSAHTVLRATAVGLVEDLTWQEIMDGLHSEHTQLRLVTVRAKSGALILDDTYNASPESTLAALNLLEELEGRKVAVLGDMLELGPYEATGHEMVGVRAAEVVDELVTVGERAVMIAAAAEEAGLPPRVITRVQDSHEAIKFLGDRLRAEDVVLIKGSRGMQMDQIVSALEAS